jgi:hypothetical protein
MWRKTCPSAILSSTNLIWTDLGLNVGLHAARMVTKLPEPWHGPFHLVYGISNRCKRSLLSYTHLTLSNPIFLPTAYSPALICFWWERGWSITCNYPTVLKEKNKEKQKEYNLHYLLAKVRTT